MKKLLLSVVMFASAVSLANIEKLSAQGLLEYKVVQATFAPEHVNNAGPAYLSLNYNKSQITLNIQELHQCPAGRMCAMVLRAPVRVELPIVSVKTDSCGIRHVTAKLDQRPVDGGLKQITLIDPSQMTCKTFMAVAIEATYQTEYLDRMTAKSIVHVSRMVLSLISNVATINSDDSVLEMSLAPAILIKFVQSTGFSPEPSVKTLYVDVTGRVINSNKQIKTGKVVNTAIAQLSPEALKSLVSKVATIPADAKLIDQNEGEPRCMDAPTSSITVTTKGQEVVVYQFIGCHTLSVQSGYSSQLYEVMMGFLSLAQ